MEIFQTIWTSLTTENEVITNLLGFPICFLDAFVVMLFFTTLLNIKATKKQKILYVVVFSVLGYICRTSIPNPYGTFINAFLMPTCVILIFHTSILKGILAEVVPTAVSTILEIVVFKLYYVIFNVTVNEALNIPIYRILGVLTIYLIIHLLTLLAKHINFNISLLDNLPKKTKTLLILNSIAAIILIFTQIYLINFYNEKTPLVITIASLISLVTYFLISLYSMLNTTKLQQVNTSLEEAQLYNKTLQILHDHIRAFKHDFWNIVQGIGGYIGKNDMEGLKKYYAKLVEDCHQVNNLTALSPSVVNNPAVYNVLAHKYHKADELGIKINLDVFMDLNELNINSYELTRILGILMNNAIEASKECEDKTINVTFRKDNKRPMQLIIIENTYKDKNIDTEKIYEKGYSTKEGNTGLGLWEIRQIMKKHNNLNLYTTKNSEYFSQQFEIFF